MRHFRRLYFDNPAIAGATESFVSIIDKGRDGHGHPLYNIRVGDLTLPRDVTQIDDYVLATSCFFKLPIGANAIVDIYAPDLVGSPEPLSFDYQVFKAKPAPAWARNAAQSTASAKYAPSGPARSSGQAGPSGPSGETSGNTGPTATQGSTSASVCTYPGSCGGQSSVDCEPGQEPLFYQAVCHCDGGECYLTCEPVRLTESEDREKVNKTK